LLRGGNVVPPAVLEIDQGLVVAVDSNDAADDAGEALQLGPLRVDAHELVGPPPLQLLVALVGRVHEGKPPGRESRRRSSRGRGCSYGSAGKRPARPCRGSRACGRREPASTSFHTRLTAVTHARATLSHQRTCFSREKRLHRRPRAAAVVTPGKGS